MPTLHDGDIVLVDLGRRAPTPPGVFVLYDGMRLVAKRVEHIHNSDPLRVRIISDSPLCMPYEGSGNEVNHQPTGSSDRTSHGTGRICSVAPPQTRSEGWS
jgi:hypothetical protein